MSSGNKHNFISSISMYKFAVENGIRAINWKEIQLPRYNKNTYEVKVRKSKLSLPTLFWGMHGYRKDLTGSCEFWSSSSSCHAW